MKAVFETATIADVVGKATRVAPTRGSAFDQAAGIVIELDADTNTVSVRATNLEIFYLEVVDAISIEGSGRWRIPSNLLNGILSKLPIGEGSTVSLEDDSSRVLLKSGRTVSRIYTSDPEYYPSWQAFDPEQLEVIADLGERIKMVEWAANDAGDPPLSGVHLDGEAIYATDKYRIAKVDCPAEPLTEPITIPVGAFDPVIKTMRECGIGQTPNMLLLMPDHHTQIQARIYGQEYPNIKRVLNRNQTANIKFPKASLLEIIGRAMVFSGRDRTPLLTMHIGREEVAVMMSDEEAGLLGDVLEIPGQATHRRMKIYFTPKNLTEALNAAPSDHVELFYTPDNGLLAVRIDGGSGYEAWVMPRQPPKEEK